MTDSQVVWMTIVDGMPARVFPTYKDAAAERVEHLTQWPNRSVRIAVANFWTKAPVLQRAEAV
jgi:hypothetical protein